MIMSMTEEFEKNGFFWSRYNGGWMKTVTGLDKSKKNGFSLIGDFVDAGKTKNDYESGLYINCNIHGSRKHQYKTVQLIKLNDDGSMELIQELENGGRTWAVEFWENIEKNLVVKPKKSIGEIMQDIKKNLSPEQVQQLLKELQPISPLKIGVHQFCSKVERIDKELDESIKEVSADIEKYGGFDKLPYKSKSEIFGLAILKTWDNTHYFEDDEIDRIFIPRESDVRDYSDYTLFVSDKVDGFAKATVKDGKWSIKLRLLY